MRKPQAPRPSRPPEVDIEPQREVVAEELHSRPRSPHDAPTGQTSSSSGLPLGARGADGRPGESSAADEPGGRTDLDGRGALAVPGTRAGLETFGRRRQHSQSGDSSGRPPQLDGVVSSGLTDRLAERRRAGRSLLLRRAAVWLAGVSVVALVVWAVGFSPLLALRPQDVRVTGSDGTVSVEQVRQVLSGSTGTSLVRLDLKALGKEVADSLVRVRSATVKRAWPHGVTVDLTMRVPVAARTTDAGVDVLDRDGVVLETVQQAPAGLVTVAAPEGGTEQALSAAQVAAVAQVVGSLEDSVRSQVASGQASESGQVTLLLTSGSQVRWGDTSESQLKARVLAVLMSQPHSVYDVSSPRNPTTS